MNTVILEVRSLADTLADAARAMTTGHAEGEVRIGFATPELLWQVLTAKRWELLKAMCGAGAMSIREAARRVGRDVEAVHGDVVALLNAGVLTRAAPMSPPHRCHELTGNRKGSSQWILTIHTNCYSSQAMIHSRSGKRAVWIGI